jgi:hypothetical protein
LLKPTVFLHCRYLVERKGMAPQKAIEGVCVVLAIIGFSGISSDFFFSCFQLLMTPEAIRWSGRITSTESWPLISLNEATRP